MIRIFTRQIERLHSEDGQALVFVALVGLVIFLFFAMTMNVAELVNTKIKNQNVADATALSAAVWEARSLNMVAAANRNMLELWVAALGSAEACGFTVFGCDQYLCGEVWVDPLFCLACLIVAFGACAAAGIFAAGATTTGLSQGLILGAIDRNVVDQDLPDVVGLNYAFKANTESDDVGVYVYYPSPGQELLQAYVPGQPESGDYVLERVGVCEIIVMVARYANYWWHLTDETTGLTDAQWDSLLPTIYGWYSPPDGECYYKISILPGLEDMFPLALRTRATDWSPQDLDSLLAITVATYKAQEPPPALGKGSGAADCAWAGGGDTRFACPNHRHYAFASAHAYSESASEFYNTQMAGLATGYLLPYIPFEMDWEARLFPLEPYPNGVESTSPYGGWAAYQDIANQVQNEGFGADYVFLYDNVLMLGGMHFFLY